MIEEVRRRGLGRGLSALLGETDAPPPAATLMVRVDALRPGRYQPRHRFDAESISALAQSIREKGVLQPLLVRHAPGSIDAYEIIAGERRWRAAQAAQLHEVPVVLRDIGDREALEIALVENLQREDLSPLEEAAAYHRLMEDFQNTQDAVAEAVGKSRSHVANMIRLLDLPEPVKQLLDERKLSAGHGRALLTAANPQALAQEAVRRGLSVRAVERLAKRGSAPPPAASLVMKDPDTRAVEQALSASLGLSVGIERHGSRGKVTIHFQNLEQLDDVLRRLSQTPPSVLGERVN
ncbi:MAG TPA: ParB/RepB/Spo0J family partition protein [Stellaceae bacterium]|nr:ParB/RepB/Spo0J family partition protein [Stellaceae bacterium]